MTLPEKYVCNECESSWRNGETVRCPRCGSTNYRTDPLEEEDEQNEEDE